MKKILLSLTLIMFLGLVTSQGLTPPDSIGNVTINQNITNVENNFIGGNTSFNQTLTDGLYIGWVDESSLDVDSANWWAGLTGWVSGWFFKSGNELSFNETKLDEHSDGRYWNVDGQNATGDYNVEGYIHLGEFNETPLAEQLLTKKGDLLVGGDILGTKGMVLYTEPYGQGLLIQIPNESESVVRFVSYGFLDGETKTLCDRDKNFEWSDIGKYVVFTGRSEPYEITAPIDTYLNTSCVVLTIAREDVPNIDPADFLVVEPSFFAVLDGGQSIFTLANSSDSVVRINNKEANSFTSFYVDIKAGIQDATSGIISMDADGNFDVTNFILNYLSSSEANSTQNTNLLIQSDLSNHNDGEFIIADYQILA
ncbi:unnamed protein product, partial [marine sediment metagenome]